MSYYVRFIVISDMFLSFEGFLLRLDMSQYVEIYGIRFDYCLQLYNICVKVLWVNSLLIYREMVCDVFDIEFDFRFVRWVWFMVRYKEVLVIV